MYSRQSLQAKEFSQSAAIPAQNPLASRPFAPQPQPEPIAEPTQTLEKIQVQLERAEHSMHSAANMKSAPSKAVSPQPLQMKLAIGLPGNPYEQAADRTARQVVRLHAPEPLSIRIGEPVQRAERPEDNDELRRKPEISLIQRVDLPEDDDELRRKPLIQRKIGLGSMAATPDLERSIHRERGRGELLSDTIRQPMEQAFGADFSGVRIHADGRSDQLNQSMQARAFTTGQDVFFRQGDYQPENRGGQELIAHELTHVVQQNRNLGEKRNSNNISKSTYARATDFHYSGQHLQRKIELDFSKIPKESLSTVKEIVRTAYQYIMSTKTGKTVWEDIKKSPHTIQVQVRADDFAPTTFSVFDLFGPDKGEEEIKEFLGVTSNLFVRWNVMDLLVLDPEEKTNLIPKSGPANQSVANALVHELGHARQLLHPEMVGHAMKWRKGERDALKEDNRELANKYNLLIELHNLLNHEIPFSIETGEPVRVKYQGGGKQLTLSEALEDAKARLKPIKKQSNLPWENAFDYVEKRISELEMEVIKIELDSQDYTIPEHIDLEELEKEFESLAEELLEMKDEAPSYLETIAKPYRVE
ncbi:DUF4157 domain-containing protein [Synechococcus sp. PCC 7336]|uniref:eCIS core domain-containing protein n=1 Tax=Synechococcus sp. PCC 7336 TaxID=195250 RepID=UPI00034A9939|nr:DUF4157 domain-containing protein [Synechococcus sp. PCC 7336]